MAGKDGRIYFIGGIADGRQYRPIVVPDVRVYDPKSNRWSLGAAMPTARAGLAAITLPDGEIYAIGGNTAPALLGDYRDAGALATVEIYDPRANHW